MFTKKNILRICCNQKFPPKSHFPPPFFRKLPSGELVFATTKRHLQSASSKSGSWSIHPARPQASTQTHHQNLASVKAASAATFSTAGSFNGKCVWLAGNPRNSYHVWRLFFRFARFADSFQHLTSPFGFPRCFSVAKSWNSNGRSQWDEACFSGIRTKNKLYTSENLKIPRGKGETSTNNRNRDDGFLLMPQVNERYKIPDTT